jgi:hypothetical protein
MWHVWRKGELCTRCWWGKPEGKREKDVDGRIMLRWIFRKWEGVCGAGMELVQDRDRWVALVNAVMNFGVP